VCERQRHDEHVRDAATVHAEAKRGEPKHVHTGDNR
jgi:hypothetical protein